MVCGFSGYNRWIMNLPIRIPGNLSISGLYDLTSVEQHPGDQGFPMTKIAQSTSRHVFLPQRFAGCGFLVSQSCYWP